MVTQMALNLANAIEWAAEKNFEYRENFSIIIVELDISQLLSSRGRLFWKKKILELHPPSLS